MFLMPCQRGSESIRFWFDSVFGQQHTRAPRSSDLKRSPPPGVCPEHGPSPPLLQTLEDVKVLESNYKSSFAGGRAVEPLGVSSLDSTARSSTQPDIRRFKSLNSRFQTSAQGNVRLPVGRLISGCAVFLAEIANSTAAQVRWEAEGHLIQSFADPECRGLGLNLFLGSKLENSRGSLCDVADSLVSGVNRPVLASVIKRSERHIHLLTGCHPVS